MQAKRGSFQTFDGLTLATYSYLPQGQPRAALVVSHGYAEHAGRYAALAERLVAEGYAVCVIDHRGHGQSGGRRANVRVMNEYVHDLTRFLDIVREDKPRVPRLLLGHSVGALVALQATLEHPAKVEGLVLSAAFLQNAVPVPPLLGNLAARLSRLAPQLPVQTLDVTALARDEAVVKAYQDDPLVYHGKVKARIGHEMLRTGPYLLARAASITLPTLLQHGGADRIASPLGSRELYERLGSKDKMLKLYDGAYHEIYNDYGRDNVINDLLDWLGAHTPAEVFAKTPAGVSESLE